MTFNEEKEALLKEAAELGIVDVVAEGRDGIDLDTLRLAIELTRKHAPSVYKRLEKRHDNQ